MRSVQKQLRADDQALLDAIAPGDKAVWERLLAQDAVYVDENGAVMHRAQFLAALKPLPPASERAHFHRRLPSQAFTARLRWSFTKTMSAKTITASRCEPTTS